MIMYKKNKKIMFSLYLDDIIYIKENINIFIQVLFNEAINIIFFEVNFENISKKNN